MKIQCDCGTLIYDGTDDLPHKAHVIPDQHWNALFEALDTLIEEGCKTSNQRSAACTRIRSMVGAVARPAWQCRECGRLFVEDASHQLQGFAPDRPEGARDLFRGTPGVGSP